VLRLLNTDIGSGIATTIGVIFAGVGAKLALTAVSMGQIGKKGDIVRNTWAALTGTFTAVGQAFTRMSTGLGPGVVTKHIKPLSAALSGIANSTRIASTFTVSPSGGVVPLKVLSEVEAKAKLASRGLKAAQLGTTLLSGALFGLADVIIPLAIVVGVVWSINKAITALGLNSVKVNDQLSQLGIREQKHEGAAKAGGTAARLFTTASEAVTQAHTTPKKLKILKDTAEAAYGNEPDTDVRKKKIEALQAEFEQLYKNLGATEATERAKKLLTEQTTAALAHQATERRKAYEADVATDENLKDQIEDWKTGMLKQGYTPEKRKEKIKELEGQRSANADKRTIKTFEEMETNANDLKLFLEADQKHQVFLEKQKVLVQSISDIYAQMPHEGQTDTLNNEILKLETTLNLHTAILALIREEKAKREASGKDTRTDDALAAEIGRNEEAASTNRSRVRQNLKYAVAKNPSMLDTDAFTDEAGQPDEEKIRKFKTSIEGAPGFLKGSGAGEISKALGYALSQLEEIKKQETIILDLRTKQKDTVQLDSNKRIKGMEDASRKAKEENENQLEAKRIVAATQATNLIDRRGLAVDFAKAESESFQIGGTEGEQLVAQKKALEESISTKGARVDKGLDQKFNAKELAENLAQQKDEMQALAAAKQKLDNLMANSRGKGFEFPGFQGGEVAFHEGRLRGGLATEEAEIRSRPDKGETDNLINTIIQHRIALVDNLIRGNLTLVNLGKEEKNLMIEKNREQARALLTAGPGELLRKLALSQLQRTKPFSTGQFMALDPGARQDVLNEPANSKEIKDNRLSQEVLRGAGFTGLSGLQAAQAAKEKMAADNKINSKQLDSIDINETARKAVGQFATNTNLASTAVKEHTDTLVKSTEQIKNLFQHRPARSGASGSWDAPEGVAQAK